MVVVNGFKDENGVVCIEDWFVSNEEEIGMLFDFYVYDFVWLIVVFKNFV